MDREAPTWNRVLALASDRQGTVGIDAYVPDAAWFWDALSCHCVADCCGLDAYEFSDSAVRWAVWHQGEPPGIIATNIHANQPREAVELAQALASAARRIRELGVPAATATQFNHILTGDSYANLFDFLSAALLRAVTAP